MSLSFAAAGISALETATAMGMPVALAPIDSAFVRLHESGLRLILASDGVYIEACSSRLYALRRVAPCATPFGSVAPQLLLRHGPLPRALLDRFSEMAQTAHPREAAALAIVRDGSGYELHIPPSNGQTGRITYDDTGYADDAMVFDLHSHGPYSAVFSATDDVSDRSRGVPHISMVLGHCGSASTIVCAARLCVGPYLLNLSRHEITEILR